MLGLIQIALGTLWFFLNELEDKNHTIGSTFMILAISYLFASGAAVSKAQPTFLYTLWPPDPKALVIFIYLVLIH